MRFCTGLAAGENSLSFITVFVLNKGEKYLWVSNLYSKIWAMQHCLPSTHLSITMSSYLFPLLIMHYTKWQAYCRLFHSSSMDAVSWWPLGKLEILVLHLSLPSLTSSFPFSDGPNILDSMSSLFFVYYQGMYGSKIYQSSLTCQKQEFYSLLMLDKYILMLYFYVLASPILGHGDLRKPSKK